MGFILFMNVENFANSISWWSMVLKINNIGLIIVALSDILEKMLATGQHFYWYYKVCIVSYASKCDTVFAIRVRIDIYLKLYFFIINSLVEVSEGVASHCVAFQVLICRIKVKMRNNTLCITVGIQFHVDL